MPGAAPSRSAHECQAEFAAVAVFDELLASMHALLFRVERCAAIATLFTKRHYTP